MQVEAGGGGYGERSGRGCGGKMIRSCRVDCVRGAPWGVAVVKSDAISSASVPSSERLAQHDVANTMEVEMLTFWGGTSSNIRAFF